MSQLVNLDNSCLQHCLVGNALDGMCVGMIVTNPAGRVAWMNRSAQRILGIDKKEAHGELLGKVLRDPNMAELWHRVTTEDDMILGEVSLHWPRQCELKVNSSKCFDPSGNCIGRVLLFCDVTHERSVQLQMSQEATQRLLDMAAKWQSGPDDEPHGGLTAQELRILRMVGNGLANEEIAREIHVALSTVRTHLKHVYAKLQLSSRSEAISYAIRNGLA